MAKRLWMLPDNRGDRRGKRMKNEWKETRKQKEEEDGRWQQGPVLKSNKRFWVFEWVASGRSACLCTRMDYVPQFFISVNDVKQGWAQDQNCSQNAKTMTTVSTLRRHVFITTVLRGAELCAKRRQRKQDQDGQKSIANCQFYFEFWLNLKKKFFNFFFCFFKT